MISRLLDGTGMQNNKSWQRHPSRPKSADAGGDVQIIVDGISGLATESVIQRLVLKAQELHSKAVKVNRHFMNDGKLVLFVQSQIQADTLKKLSGIRIGKMNRLLIDYPPSPHQQPSVSAIDNINQLVQSRYNPAAKFLNLDSIDQSFFSRGSKAGEVLCRIIGQLCPEVETISLAQNRIKTLHNLSSLPKVIPNLINLSFKDNQITTYRDIDVFNGRDLPRLRELLFQGNPFSPDPSSASNATMLQYQYEIKQRFPSIQILDQLPIQPQVAQDAYPIQPNYFDSPISAQTSRAFLEKYFTAFDKNRSQLTPLYTEASAFSVQMHANKPPSSKYAGKIDFRQWTGLDRNILQPSSAKILIGSEITRAFQSLIPHTLHCKVDKMCVDCWESQGMLFLTVHGDFKEGLLPRSFDRSFVLAPGPSEWGVLIVSDLLAIRPFHGQYSWSSVKSSFEPTVTNILSVGMNTAPTNPQMQPISNGMHSNIPPQLGDQATLMKLQHDAQLDNLRHGQVVEFSMATGLNYAYSLQCLGETMWDMNRAMMAFQNAKPNIPPAGFQFSAIL